MEIFSSFKITSAKQNSPKTFSPEYDSSFNVIVSGSREITRKKYCTIFKLFSLQTNKNKQV